MFNSSDLYIKNFLESFEKGIDKSEFKRYNICVR